MITSQGSANPGLSPHPAILNHIGKAPLPRKITVSGSWGSDVGIWGWWEHDPHTIKYLPLGRVLIIPLICPGIVSVLVGPPATAPHHM